MMMDKSLSVSGEGAALRADGVWKTYDGVHNILKNINLELKSGDMILIRGRSGSGKSTLLNLLGCMDIPSQGKIFVNGFDTGSLSQRKLANVRLHKIGMVFQGHNLLGDLTVQENVALPMKIAGSKESKERALKLLEMFDLSSYCERFPSEISGGERQRVAVARALANSPSVLLADEPTASLDDDNCENVIEAFRRANKGLGTTVVIASHDAAVEAHIPNRYNLSKGELTGGA
ncbi:MAG: ABC transporter ATP-binding protein [Euryarchaeota archaeon]|nr:ABC transporter ATP-binding protein [Euryarchaeota archaeon]